ncbi:helix-turn-helix transcriptional regulator [Agromyces intestinalis]|uniref:Helix-turn-helix transcriptional regulator n=1 Tax=Agromyces intestinalis TaxID=2592652 RepID=A0A5C1YJ31_9MICO|nr:helix-turn-helix transcriptional regulator [Agromyces intestinalis]QEO15087.1 helix-turn-helix transcriptional regulator [Agromyces intestinalis]
MAPADPDEASDVHCRLDELLAERGMTLAKLSELVGVTVVNLSVLKNDRARAIRFSTLQAICDVLGCEIGDLLVLRRERPPHPTGATASDADEPLAG